MSRKARVHFAYPPGSETAACGQHLINVAPVTLTSRVAAITCGRCVQSTAIRGPELDQCGECGARVAVVDWDPQVRSWRLADHLVPHPYRSETCSWSGRRIIWPETDDRGGVIEER